MVFLRPSFGACAPPSPNSARNLYFLRRVGRLLMIILPSGILSRRSAPLSPKGKAFYLGICVPLSPKGKAFYPGICVPLSPKGKAVIDTAYHSPRKKKRFPPSGKTFCFPTRLLLLSAWREDFFSSPQSKRAGRLSII